MEKFDLEKAKQGRQIVHKNGRKAVDWHYFGKKELGILAIQWENHDAITLHSSEEDDLRLAPKRVEGHLTVCHGNFMTTKYQSTEYDIVVENPLEDLDVLFKVSCNPDGSDPTIEVVLEASDD